MWVSEYHIFQCNFQRQISIVRCDWHSIFVLKKIFRGQFLSHMASCLIWSATRLSKMKGGRGAQKLFKGEGSIWQLSIDVCTKCQLIWGDSMGPGIWPGEVPSSLLVMPLKCNADWNPPFTPGINKDPSLITMDMNTKVKATFPLTRHTLMPKGLQSRRANSFTNFCNHAQSNHLATVLVARVQLWPITRQWVRHWRDAPHAACVKRIVALYLFYIMEQLYLQFWSMQKKIHCFPLLHINKLTLSSHRKIVESGLNIKKREDGHFGRKPWALVLTSHFLPDSNRYKHLHVINKS